MIRKSKNVILPETPDERFLFGFTTLFLKSARFLYNGQQKNYLYLKQQCFADQERNTGCMQMVPWTDDRGKQ